MIVREIFTTLASIPGSNDKMQFLNENTNETVSLIFQDTYNKKRKYYVKKFNVTNTGVLTIDTSYNVFHDMLEDLNNRVITGNAAVEAVERMIGCFVKEDQDILCKILDRNLKVGVSLDNFNKTNGETIDKFEVALAKKLQDVKNVNPIDGTWFVSRKMDGTRCIAICDQDWVNGELVQEVKFFSRQGKELTTLSNIIPDIKQMFLACGGGTYILDGEMCLVDENGDEHFDWIMKEITRKNHTIENPCYQVFDLLNDDWFYGREESTPLASRLHHLNEVWYQTQPEHIRVAEQERLTSQEIFDKWQEKAKDGNWEGLMIRKDVPYEGKRTNNLLKIKAMQDAEYIVEGVINGKATYNEGGAKEYDIISALMIRHKGNLVKVGSGLSKEQRIGWYSRPDEIIGKVITVQYFEETKDSKTGEYSLRFPVLKYVYEDGRNC
jgi:DNA ligase-1